MTQNSTVWFWQVDERDAERTLGWLRQEWCPGLDGKAQCQAEEYGFDPTGQQETPNYRLRQVSEGGRLDQI